MLDTFDFLILNNGDVSSAFLGRGCINFKLAVDYVRHLPYKRNTDKENLLTVFSDSCGTCSTKHALLRELAIENGRPEIKLVLGVYKMSKENTPKVAGTLQRSQLEYIPEAHNYLKLGSEILDCTSSTWGAANFIDYLISEIEIESHQITSFKVSYHRSILQDWIRQNQIPFSLDQIWAIREQCIVDLSH